MKAQKLLKCLEYFVWGAMIILLPFTSVPLITRLVRSDTVAAPSGILLLFIVVFWLLPYFIKGGSLPRQTIPLLAFVLACVLSSALAYFMPLPAFKQIDLLRGNLQGLLTLAIGISFYLVLSTWPAASDERFKFILLMVNISGALVMLWSFVQAGVWYTYNRYPQWMRDINELYSIGTLYRQRVTGFTLEPSWLAHQLNMVYLPIWLAATVSRFSASRFRVWKISFENILLLGGIAVLLLTLSRVGLLAFLMMVAFLGLRGTLWFVSWLQKRISRTWQFSGWHLRWRKVLLSSLIILGVIVLYSGLLAGTAFAMMRLDRRMETMFDFSKVTGPDAFFRYAEQLAFASRVAYWQVGWEVFNDYPMFGVGLGNAGYFFQEKLSAYGSSLYEIRTLLFRAASLPNTKSLWTRILAETGMLGFSLYICWLFLMWLSGRFLDKIPDKLSKTIGLTGQLVIIGLLLEGFSLDTFALPYIWFSLGLVTALSGRTLSKDRDRIMEE
jgi:hypothetical protein